MAEVSAAISTVSFLSVIELLHEARIKTTVNKKSVKNVVKKSSDYHTVTSGESLYTIAKKYGVSVKELREMNKLNGNKIQKGQKIKVD